MKVKRFYELIPKKEFASKYRSSISTEQVENDIDELIKLEAEQCFDLDSISSEELDEAIELKREEIKRLLKENGIWYDQFGIPKFAYL